MRRLNTLLPLLLMLLVAAVGCALGFRQITPPALPAGFTEATVAVEDAQAGPDLDVMLTHLKAMASQVHSVCSPGLEVTRNYLMEQLTRMGYTYQVEEYPLAIEEVLALNAERSAFRGKKSRDTAESVRDYAGLEADAAHMPIKNVVVTLDCPGTEDTVIFMAHMDSVKFGPGTMDDTVSVAALLEALRLQKGRPLSRDLVFLFTDGEEQGMLGAAMYVKSHPEMKERTRLVVNLEARGNTGALLMFETTPNNLGLVRHFAKGTAAPAGFSIATQVYHMMANDTDLSWFMMAGYPGLNFSVIEGAEVYHTAEDNYEGFNRASAAHYLQTATDLVSYLATADLSDAQAGEDAVFFPLLKGHQVVLSATAARVLGYAALALALAAMTLALGRRQATFKGLAAEAGLQLGTLLAAAGLGLGVIKGVALANGLEKANDFLRFEPARWIFLGLMALSVGLSLAAHLWLRSRLSKPLSMAVGLLPLLWLGTLGTLLFFPAASYLFALPLLMLSLSLLATVWSAKVRMMAGPVCYALTLFFTLLLYAPIVYLVYVALNLSMAYTAAALAMIPAGVAFGGLGLMAGKSAAAAAQA